MGVQRGQPTVWVASMARLARDNAGHVGKRCVQMLLPGQICHCGYARLVLTMDRSVQSALADCIIGVWVSSGCQDTVRQCVLDENMHDAR